MKYKDQGPQDLGLFFGFPTKLKIDNYNKKMSKIKSSVCLIILVYIHAAAYECPNNFSNREGLPACPRNATNVLSDNYPVGAIVLGAQEQPFGNAKTKFQNDEMTYSMIYQMGKTQTEIPLIVMSMTQESYDNVLGRIEKSDLSPDQKNKLKLRLAHAKVSENYTWQQDFYQPVATASGQIRLKANNAYINSSQGGPAKEHMAAISKVLKSCGVNYDTKTDGMDYENYLLKANGKEFRVYENGASAGNVEALPGGTCIIGSDNFASKDKYNKFVKNFCDDKNNLEIDTSWLQVGHTDEILKVFPDKTKNANDPCAFSIGLASPALAIDLLKKNPNESFFDYEKLSSPYPSLKEMVDSRRLLNPTINKLCNKYDNKKIPYDKELPVNKGGDEKGNTFFKKIFKIFVKRAVAEGTSDSDLVESSEVEADSGASSESQKNSEARGCENATNGQIVDLFNTDPELSQETKDEQKKLDEIEESLKAKLKVTHPNCNIRIEKFPSLFVADAYQSQSFDSEKNSIVQGKKLSLSINPNPTNGVVIGNQYYMPSQGNKEFAEYMKKTIEKNGLKVNEINTQESTHFERGNLHCATQTIPLCR